jgi:hypothetical protein
MLPDLAGGRAETAAEEAAEAAAEAAAKAAVVSKHAWA